MRFWLTRYQSLLILVLVLPVRPPEDFAISLDAPANHSVESPAQSSRVKQLEAFLHRRWEGIESQRVGIPRLGRRRTPGLYRKEVTQPVGVDVAWYIWLGQSHTVRASKQVIGAIARALLCNEMEAHHLFNLTELAAPTSARRAACKKLSAATQAILDVLDPLPAMVRNARLGIRGYNRVYCRLVGTDLAEIPEEDRDCTYLTLTHERWRYCMANYEEALLWIIGFFHVTMAECMGDTPQERQLQRCPEVSAEFREIWRRDEVTGAEDQLKCFRYARCGEFELQQTN